MSGSSRTKGKAGEREIAAIVRDLTGWNVQRRVRQHDGDSDLEGAPGWSVEVKRHRTATRGDVARWWAQAVAQADQLLPVLLYRLDRDTWRAVWPVALFLVEQRAEAWRAYEWTAETSVEAWAAVAREVVWQIRYPPKHAAAKAPEGAATCIRRSTPDQGPEQAADECTAPAGRALMVNDHSTEPRIGAAL